MFRRGRRPMARMLRGVRPWARSPLARPSRLGLVRANRLMEIGDFANAAVLYNTLARQVHDLGRPRQAGHLYVQAARAMRLSGQIQPALDLYEQGLEAFALAGLWRAFEQVGDRAVNELRKQNQPQAADELARWMQATLAGQPLQMASDAANPDVPQPSRRSLPLKCPSCGATVRSDDVEWIDNLHAECDYCGSTLAAE